VNLEEIPTVYHFGSVVEWGANTAHQRCGILITWYQQVYFVGQWADLPSKGTVELGIWNHMAHRSVHSNGWLHPRGGCGQKPSPQNILKACVAADFERR
jgi:hypothetical protein